MKKFLIVISALVLSVSFAAAQPQQGNGQRPDKEKMTKMQMKRIVKALALDNTTAEAFEKTYTAYTEECNKVKEKYPVRSFMGKGNIEKGSPKGKKGENEAMLPTDEEVEQQILNGFARERGLLDIKEKYYKEFCKILTPQQIQKMYQMQNAPRQRTQNGNMPGQGGRPGGFPGGQMGGMTPPPGMW